MFMLQMPSEVLKEVFFLSKMEIYLSLKDCSHHLTSDHLTSHHLSCDHPTSDHLTSDHLKIKALYFPVIMFLSFLIPSIMKKAIKPTIKPINSSEIMIGRTCKKS